MGAIKGAFLEAGPLPEKYRPLYSELPPRGIPGVEEGSIIEGSGNICGQEDAPHNWYVEFDREVIKAGFIKGKFES